MNEDEDFNDMLEREAEEARQWVKDETARRHRIMPCGHFAYRAPYFVVSAAPERYGCTGCKNNLPHD